MSKIISVVLLMATIYLCTLFTAHREKKLLNALPEAEADISNHSFSKLVYVPVHSKLYLPEGARQLYLNTILKIRNASFADSIYISRVEYYDHEGEMLKNYLSSAILLKPMSTVEVIIKNNEHKGKGDNFIVEWRASRDSIIPPVIQSIASDASKCIVFLNEGVNIGE